MFRNVLHDADIQSFQQSNSSSKTLFEVDFATHGTFGNGTHFRTNAIALCQLVDTFRLDKCRVHIEADEASHAAEHIIFLEREINFHFLR